MPMGCKTLIALTIFNIYASEKCWLTVGLSKLCDLCLFLLCQWKQITSFTRTLNWLMFLEKFCWNENQCSASHSSDHMSYFRENNIKKFKILFAWYSGMIDFFFFKKFRVGPFQALWRILASWYLVTVIDIFLGLQIQELIEWGWFWSSSTTLVFFEQHIVVIFPQSPEINVLLLCGYRR